MKRVKGGGGLEEKQREMASKARLSAEGQFPQTVDFAIARANANRKSIVIPKSNARFTEGMSDISREVPATHESATQGPAERDLAGWQARP